LKKQASVTSPTSEFNPFGSSNGSAKQQQQQTSNQNDLFGLDLSNMGSSTTNGNGLHTNGATNHLLSMNGPNPFMSSIVTQQAYNMQPLPMVNNPFGAPMMMPPQQQQQPMNLFQSAPANNFSANKMSKLLFLPLKFEFSRFISHLAANKMKIFCHIHIGIQICLI
jgi:hypothetical protein